MAQERNDLERSDRTQVSDSASELETQTTGAVEDGSADDRTEQIKEQIDETRTQMGETIDAIQDKLSFSNLSEQVSDHVTNAVETAKDAVYGATIGKAASIMKTIGNDVSGSKVVKMAKDNPLPFVLIGAGVGLLAYKAYTADDTKRGHTPLKGLARPTDVSESKGSVIDSAKGKLSTASSKVSSATGTAYEKVSGAAGAAYAGAGDAASKAYEKIGDLGSSVRGQYDTQIQDHPLAVGAVALALGAAVGMAIPATRYEGELFGNARQDLMDKAQGAASNLVDKAKDAVSEAGQNLGEQLGKSEDAGRS